MTSLDEPDVPEQLRLADPASTATYADWEAAAAGVLRKSGRLAEDAPDSDAVPLLTRTTLDGVPITPLGTAASVEGIRTSGRPTRAGEWDVRAPVDGRLDTRAHEEALADLDGGVTSLWVRAGAETDLAVVLADVLLDIAPVVLSAPETPLASAEALLALARDAGVAPHPDTNLGADPIGDAVRHGKHAPAAEDFAALVDLARGAGVRAIVVDATVAHDLGASDAQELGYALAVGAAYLRALERAGIEPADAAGLMEFRYAVTDEQLPSIAKLRAARRLWARLLELSGVPDGRQRQHAVTSRPMTSAYDPWVNLLRDTVAAFAAGVGGADAVTVLPFDDPLGVPEAFGRRLARNTSALLIHESHVATVTDPAGGSYAVERLTDDLATAAWVELGRIEGSGGIEAALADGSLRARIDDVVATRDRQVATRKRPVTGLSEFPDAGETRLERAVPPTGDPAVRRYGAAFEALRDAPADRPAYLATMGTVAAHTARATFAANLLAAGGITTHNRGAHADAHAVLADYAGEPVVCLCGTDAAYAEWGTLLAGRLREAGARLVVVAGKPLDGCDDNAAAGGDALDFLTRTREELR